jgi:hypothetical protein
LAVTQPCTKGYCCCTIDRPMAPAAAACRSHAAPPAPRAGRAAANPAASRPAQEKADDRDHHEGDVEMLEQQIAVMRLDFTQAGPSGGASGRSARTSHTRRRTRPASQARRGRTGSPRPTGGRTPPRCAAPATPCMPQKISQTAVVGAQRPARMPERHARDHADHGGGEEAERQRMQRRQAQRAAARQQQQAVRGMQRQAHAQPGKGDVQHGEQAHGEALAQLPGDGQPRLPPAPQAGRSQVHCGRPASFQRCRGRHSRPAADAAPTRAARRGSSAPRHWRKTAACDGTAP